MLPLLSTILFSFQHLPFPTKYLQAPSRFQEGPFFVGSLLARCLTRGCMMAGSFDQSAFIITNIILWKVEEHLMAALAWLAKL